MAHKSGRLLEVRAQLERDIRAETNGEACERMMRDLKTSLQKLRDKYQLPDELTQNQERK